MSPPDSIEQVARAILYEGYLLYPYRLSSLKNRQRWNFGILFPPAFCESHQAGDASVMQTECLVEGTPDTVVRARVQFLQYSADATLEREVRTGEHSLRVLLEQTIHVPISFPDLAGAVAVSATPINPKAFQLTVRIC